MLLPASLIRFYIPMQVL